MALEIERKFLVDMSRWQRPTGGVRMRQGYVETADGTTVRVRIAGDRAFLTLKDHAVGLTRRNRDKRLEVDLRRFAVASPHKRIARAPRSQSYRSRLASVLEEF